MEKTLFYLVPISAITALGFAYYFFRKMMQESEGNDTMKTIAQHVREGAMSYLKQQYRVVTWVFVVISLIMTILAIFKLLNPWVPGAFLTGGFFAGLAGFLGMKAATYASARTANASQRSLNSGLQVAFRSGAVMGLVVVGLALLDISVWYMILDVFVKGADQAHKTLIITTTLLTFGMGVSVQALFARVGGGIYTKAADVGADLVGKIEAGIPEDDPRNPATIADNVGDNVGDVAGMGTDLYESYCGAILASAALGAAAFMSNAELQLKAVFAPMLIAAVGIFLSILGIFLVRTREDSNIKQLMSAMNRGVNTSSLMIAIATFAILYMLGIQNWFGISCAVVCGLIAGIVIGQGTEYFTSHSYNPTRKVAKSGETGPATVIISGMGLGLVSTFIPVITISIAIIMSYLCAIEFKIGGNLLSAENLSMGLYGIGIAAVGMLSSLGITLATDAYGPIADNAGGNAQMSQLHEDVRKRTDALDALGNTTAATGKGFAIGSAALTVLALLASYIEGIKVGLERIGVKTLETAEGVKSITVATFTDVVTHYQVTLMNPKVLIGIFLGSMVVFLFCGLTMNAVARAAGKMVEEVRRQFREIAGILEGHAKPDYAKCVQISTKAAQREMMFPSLLAIMAPIATGLIFGVAGVMGLLVGALGSGFLLAIFMANAGGAWDNAKKYVEEGHYGGKGSVAHTATVVGDTVGDPFKDTSGPSLNTLIKLMSVVAIVMAGLTVSWSLF